MSVINPTLVATEHFIPTFWLDFIGLKIRKRLRPFIRKLMLAHTRIFRSPQVLIQRRHQASPDLSRRGSRITSGLPTTRSQIPGFLAYLWKLSPQSAY